MPRRTVDLTVPKLLAQSKHSVEDGLVRLEKGRESEKSKERKKERRRRPLNTDCAVLSSEESRKLNAKIIVRSAIFLNDCHLLLQNYKVGIAKVKANAYEL